MTKRTTGAAAKRRPAAAVAGDPGHYLPLLAASHADRARRPKTPLSWSEALAAAPWGPELPAAWEGAFREAYARRLVDLGSALPAAKRGATSGPSGTTELVQCKLYLSKAEQGAQKALARAAGLSWSTWARRKLAPAGQTTHHERPPP